METLLTVLLIILFIFVTNVLDNKKQKVKRPPQRTEFPGVPPIPPKMPPPMPKPWSRVPDKQETSKPVGFEIPELKTQTRAEDEEARRATGTLFNDQTEKYAREQAAKNKYQAYLEERKHIRHIKQQEQEDEQVAYEREVRLSGWKTVEGIHVDVRPRAMMDAVAYAMLLGKPKAYENMMRYGGFRKT